MPGREFLFISLKETSSGGFQRTQKTDVVPTMSDGCLHKNYFLSSSWLDERASDIF